jgi:rod shape-determining protein MreC
MRLERPRQNQNRAQPSFSGAPRSTMPHLSWWHVPLILVLIGGFVFWQNSASTRGKMSPSDAIATTTLSPVQRVFRNTGDYLSDVGRVIFRRDDLASQNAKLQAQLDDYKGQNARLLRYRRENDELRSLLKMPKVPGGKAVPAEVIFSNSTNLSNRIVLNAGSTSGVRPKDIVYCAKGLVGQVTQVSPFTCTVTLPIDRQGSVGAVISRTGARGVLLGNGNRVAKLAYLDFNADVREGDIVLTSGLSKERGAIFPRGIVLGTVLKVEKNPAYMRQDAFVAPSVEFEKLNAVWIRVAQSE